MLTFGLALVVGLAAVPGTRLVLVRAGVLDVPNQRSSHRQAVPRGGGVAVGIAATSALMVTSWGVAAAALASAAVALGAVGAVDDVRGVAVRTRLAVQFLVPVAAVPFLVHDADAALPLVVLFGVSVVWCAAYVNAFNFMDGINGIAAAQAVIAGLACAVLGAWHDDTLLVAGGLAIAGAMLGFVPFNFPTARLFLGDVGSYFAGAWLALLPVLAIRSGVPAEVAAAPFAVFVADTGTTLVRRWRRGQRLSVAHREHAYQQLVDLGWSHATVTGVFAVLSSAIVAVMLAVDGEAAAVRAGGVLVAATLAAGFVLLPRYVGHRVLVPAG